MGVSSSELRNLLEQDVILFLGFPEWCRWEHGSPGKTNFLWVSLVSLAWADERGVTLDEELWSSRLDALLSRMRTFPVLLHGSCLELLWLVRVGGAWRNPLPFLNLPIKSFILSLVTACSVHVACTCHGHTLIRSVRLNAHCKYNNHTFVAARLKCCPGSVTWIGLSLSCSISPS